MNNKQQIINLEGITFRYPGARENVIDNLDLKFFSGSRIGLIAPNGSGKTTLFHIIMGLLKPDAGRIEIFGQPVSREKDFEKVRRRIGLLFQDADDQLFSPTVLEDVAFGPLNLGKSKEEAIDISRKTLAFLGLSDFEERITFKLSGGEKRLVSLATVLSMEPEVLLLDEPTTGLDNHTREKLIEALNSLDLAYIVISHEYDFVNAVAPEIYKMENGQIFHDEELQIHIHEHVHRYGREPHKHG
ncbi:MAG: ABC transporter ATP-binding protein [Desulfobacterales bacterium]|nr:ABC transporter ATP-binding protein [Desulfobacterales bacterium]